MKKEDLDVIRGGLADAGFKKRAGRIFTIELSRDVIGWLGLNTATKHHPEGVVSVNPVVGVRHQPLERLVAELSEREFHRYMPPSVSSPLGYLMPEESYTTWTLGRKDSARRCRDLVSAVVRYGVPFMQQSVSLAALSELIDHGMGFKQQLIYRRPVARYLLGDFEKTEEALSDAEAHAGDRGDPAALELRIFILNARRCLSTAGG